MKFKTWLLTEAGHGTLHPPYNVQGGVVSAVDMYFEIWRVSGEEAQTAKLNLQQLIPPSFYGKLPDNKYLVHHKEDHYRFKIESNSPVDEEKEDDGWYNLDNIQGLEGYWWDYAVGWDVNDKIIKPSKYANLAAYTYQSKGEEELPVGDLATSIT